LEEIDLALNSGAARPRQAGRSGSGELANLANQVGLVGVPVPAGQSRPVDAAVAQVRQHRVEPGDTGELVGAQPELTAKRPDEVTLAPELLM